MSRILSGCIASLPGGNLVAQVVAPDAFEEDCVRAAIVVTSREAPTGCAALAIDRKVLRAQGATALTRSGDGFEIIAARPAGQDRPWARAGACPRRCRARAITVSAARCDAANGGFGGGRLTQAQ